MSNDVVRPDEAALTASYRNLPLLKPPVWTWEVPLYFFIGGTSGVAAVLGAAAQVTGGDEKLIRDARWIAAIGANLSTPLLIMDLGRPQRFLNMLRVFKPQSPMSVGAWIVAIFGGSATASALAPAKPLRDLAAGLSAVAGLGMATYTGVLLGATANPVWKHHVRLLPAHFGTSALGSAVALLELRGHREPALNMLGLGAAIFETATGFAIEEESMLLKISEALTGSVPLVLRLFGKRKAAAAASLLGSLITRFAWVEAGKKSAREG